jgi:hypothetical protein
LLDAAVPDTLLTDAQMQHKALLQPPAFVPLRSAKAVSTAVGVGAPVLGGLFGTASKHGDFPNKVDNSASTLGVTQRQLSNGLRVSMKPLEAEPQKMHVRLYIPGTGVKINDTYAGSIAVCA